MATQLTEAQIDQYYATEGKKAQPLSPLAWLAQQQTALPSLDGVTPQQPGLPRGDQSPLLSFAQSLDQAVNLARKSRNQSSLDLMAPYRGTVQASDFNAILGNLNAASDKTSADLIKRATETEKPKSSDIVTTTNDSGDVTAIDKATGTILWTTKGVGNKQSSPDGKLTEGELKRFINQQIATDDFKGLTDDEKADYIRSQGGTPYDFGF